MPSFPPPSTVPGVPERFPSRTWERYNFTASPPNTSVDALGQGIRPRIWSWISWALRLQSTGDSYLDSMGAKDTPLGSWGVRPAVPASIRATASKRRGPPSSASRP